MPPGSINPNRTVLSNNDVVITQAPTGSPLSVESSMAGQLNTISPTSKNVSDFKLVEDSLLAPPVVRAYALGDKKKFVNFAEFTQKLMATYPKEFGEALGARNGFSSAQIDKVYKALVQYLKDSKQLTQDRNKFLIFDLGKEPYKAYLRGGQSMDISLNEIMKRIGGKPIQTTATANTASTTATSAASTPAAPSNEYEIKEGQGLAQLAQDVVLRLVGREPELTNKLIDNVEKLPELLRGFLIEDKQLDPQAKDLTPGKYTIDPQKFAAFIDKANAAPSSNSTTTTGTGAVGAAGEPSADPYTFKYTIQDGDNDLLVAKYFKDYLSKDLPDLAAKLNEQEKAGKLDFQKLTKAVGEAIREDERNQAVLLGEGPASTLIPGGQLTVDVKKVMGKLGIPVTGATPDTGAVSSTPAGNQFAFSSTGDPAKDVDTLFTTLLQKFPNLFYDQKAAGLDDNEIKQSIADYVVRMSPGKPEDAFAAGRQMIIEPSAIFAEAYMDELQRNQANPGAGNPPPENNTTSGGNTSTTGTPAPGAGVTSGKKANNSKTNGANSSKKNNNNSVNNGQQPPSNDDILKTLHKAQNEIPGLGEKGYLESIGEYANALNKYNPLAMIWNGTTDLSALDKGEYYYGHFKKQYDTQVGTLDKLVKDAKALKEKIDKTTDPKEKATLQEQFYRKYDSAAAYEQMIRNTVKEANGDGKDTGHREITRSTGKAAITTAVLAPLALAGGIAVGGTLAAGGAGTGAAAVGNIATGGVISGVGNYGVTKADNYLRGAKDEKAVNEENAAFVDGFANGVIGNTVGVALGGVAGNGGVLGRLRAGRNGGSTGTANTGATGSKPSLLDKFRRGSNTPTNSTPSKINLLDPKAKQNVADVKNLKNYEPVKGQRTLNAAEREQVGRQKVLERNAKTNAKKWDYSVEEAKAQLAKPRVGKARPYPDLPAGAQPFSNAPAKPPVTNTNPAPVTNTNPAPVTNTNPAPVTNSSLQGANSSASKAPFKTVNTSFSKTSKPATGTTTLKPDGTLVSTMETTPP